VRDIYTMHLGGELLGKRMEREHLGDLGENRRMVLKTDPTKIWREVFFLICIVGGGVQTGSTRHVGHLPAPGDCEDGQFGGMNGRGNRSTRRKPATLSTTNPT
jgi:hypothetical protein